MKLQSRLVEKPWGITALPAPYESMGAGRRIGEVEFVEAGDRPARPLLVKYIFTSERLSVQVHPNDEQAQARGLRNGKTECWYILAAEPGASLGLGFRGEPSREALRRAALNGSIVDLLDWKLVRAGDFFYVPAGTVHSIGGGISLIEIHQQSDVTYRLYDYGRPRPLHLEGGLDVSKRGAYAMDLTAHFNGDADCTLMSGPYFRLEYVIGDGSVEALADRTRWILPIRGRARAVDDDAGPGECLLVGPSDPVVAYGAAALLVAAASD